MIKLNIYKKMTSEFILFQDPFYNHILPNINPLDIITLRQTCKHYNDTLNTSHFENRVISIINNKLNIIFGDDFEEFKLIMDKSKAIISGSFIIQTILNEYWPGSDIDIYLPNIYQDNLIDFMAKINKFTKIVTTENHYVNLIKCTTYNESYLNTNGKIQIISILTNCIGMAAEHTVGKSINSMCDFVKTSFDLNICKNIFYYKNNKSKLIIDNLNNLINKKMQLCQFKNPNNIIGRIKKYTERGFVLDKSNLKYDMLKDIYNIIEIKDVKEIFNPTIFDCPDNCYVKLFDINIEHYHNYYCSFGKVEYNTIFMIKN
jgi:hypothetical protein